jgi:hypothetical protein
MAMTLLTKLADAAKWLLFFIFRLLNSVPFGIMLMALTAGFIAVGSSRPWLRDMGVDEWPGFRNWFDKTDMQFFNAWPLKTLMFLLVTNLIVVTWRKIPLTPPRYGVWCVHAGIITLVCGTCLYYNLKVEGRVRLYVDPTLGPTTVDHFYDKDERSLFVRSGQEDLSEIPLPTLPRFKEYDDRHDNVDALVSRGLTGIEPTGDITDQKTGEKHPENVAELIGCKGQKLKCDVVGFYPYATISTDFTNDPASQETGLDVTMQKIADSQVVDEWWLVESDPRFRSDNERALMDMTHLSGDETTIKALSEAAGQLFHLDVSLPNLPVMPMDVSIGKSYPVGTTGYALKINSFQPNFPTFDTGEPVALLELQVTSPTQTFRRFVMQDKPDPTDFKIGAKVRQPKPMDPNLKIAFHVHDPYQLLPQQNSVKHTLITPPTGTELVDISAGIGSVPSEVKRFPTGVEDIPVSLQNDTMNAPFAGGAAGAPPTDTPEDHPAVKIHVERRNHIHPVDSILVTKPGRRDKNAEDEGSYQVIKLKVSMGDWSTIVFAPYTDSAADHLRQDVWRGGYVTPPGALAPLQFQLGNTTHPLPVRLTLDNFKLVPYPGATVDTPNAMMLDFISTVRLDSTDTTDGYTDVARMNHPIYFNGGKWLFFQAAYDAGGGHEWTQLGVGNRPAVNIMIGGCLMIFFGLAYAFYAKPIIIRRMKQNAIAKAMANGKTIRKEKQKELV